MTREIAASAKYNLNVPTNARPIIPGFDSNTTSNLRRANPIKHWRKQLVPIFGNFSRSAVTVRNAIDAPGANSKQTKSDLSQDISDTCNRPNYIKHSLINNMVNICGNQGSNKKLCDPTTIRRPATTNINTHFNRSPRVNRRVSSNYHQTHASYLRSKVKLHNQNQTITPKYLHSPEYNSVYCLNCSNSDVPTRRPVIYNPNNRGFSNQGAVSSSLRTLNIQAHPRAGAVNKGAVALEDTFGTAVRNNSRYRGLNREPITTKSFYERSDSGCRLYSNCNS